MRVVAAAAVLFVLAACAEPATVDEIATPTPERTTLTLPGPTVTPDRSPTAEDPDPRTGSGRGDYSQHLPVLESRFASAADARIGRIVLRIFGSKQAHNAIRVFDCESGDSDGAAPYSFDPAAVGQAGEVGVAQIHSTWRKLAGRMGYEWADLHQPTPNVRVAYRIYSQHGGWVHWACARRLGLA